ncbi:MAG: hypothetical protein M3Y75_00790 [Actinomycetota bacterium]|nr:hypothetical protein [Actinomycetota bacterium]
MAVMARDMWTDERLDDLATQVDKRFDRVEADIREVKADLKTLHSEMNARFDSMQRTMIIGFVTMSASIIAALVGVTFAA